MLSRRVRPCGWGVPALGVLSAANHRTTERGPRRQRGWVAGASWTLNGVTLTPDSCQKERISSINLLVLSDYDPNQNIEFVNVTCRPESLLDNHGAERSGARLCRCGIRSGSGKTCRRYSGQASTYATTQFPAMPVPVPLRAVTGCP